MIVADQKKIIYVHIYKTGGSTITSLLMPYITENFRNKHPKTSGSNWQSSWHFDKIQHSKFADALPILEKSNINLNEHFKFAFVRNPYSWILSIWNNFYQSPRRNLPNNLPNNLKFLLRVILNKKLDSQYFYEMYPDGSFKNFVLFIDEVVNNNPKLAEKVWGASDQYSFIENNQNVEFDFIGRFENLQEDMNKISKIVNAKQLAKMPNKVFSKNQQDRQNYLQFYDQKSIKIINKIFARDFQVFGYKPISIV